jgi:hypothetical protein
MGWPCPLSQDLGVLFFFFFFFFSSLLSLLGIFLFFLRRGIIHHATIHVRASFAGHPGPLQPMIAEETSRGATSSKRANGPLTVGESISLARGTSTCRSPRLLDKTWQDIPSRPIVNRGSKPRLVVSKSRCQSWWRPTKQPACPSNEQHLPVTPFFA